VVADFDSSEAYREAERRYGPLPSTWTVVSRRGSHLLFDHPGGFIKSGPVDAIPGLDIKADSSGGGALAVAPGSRHRSGHLYAFEASGHPEDMPRAGAPAWIADLASARRQPVRSGEELHVIPDGRRNSTLLHHAGKLRRSGYTVEEIGPMLHAINERRCDPPLYSHEVDGITARAADWDAGEFELGPERGELERELMEARRRLAEEHTAHSEMMAVLRNPNIRTERGTAIAAVLELNHKVAKGETVTLPGRGGGWVRMPTARIAEQAGIAKPQNAAGHVKRLAEWGVFDRTIETKQAREIDAETGK
jgi:hypothetical protein